MSEKLHTNGTACFEGTQNVPDGFVPCCDSFKRRTLACHWDNVRIQFLSKAKEWGILVQDGSFIIIEYCPHCGAKL